MAPFSGVEGGGYWVLGTLWLGHFALQGEGHGRHLLRVSEGEVHRGISACQDVPQVGWEGVLLPR